MLIIGRSDQLPEEVRADIDRAMEQTAGNTGMKLAVALNYGGRAELVDAFNRILDRVRSNGLANARVDEEMISQHLYTSRTARSRPAHSHQRRNARQQFSCCGRSPTPKFFVTETLWPDFSRAQLYEALLEFQKRERRYGGLTEAAAASWPDPPRSAPLRRWGWNSAGNFPGPESYSSATHLNLYFEKSSSQCEKWSELHFARRFSIRRTCEQVQTVIRLGKEGMNSGTGLRVLATAILIPVVVAAIWWGPNWLIAVLSGLVAVAAASGIISRSRSLGFGSIVYGLAGRRRNHGTRWYASRMTIITRLGESA